MVTQTLVFDDAGVPLIGSMDGPAQSRDAVLLLHGFTGHRMELAYFFVDLARRLAARGAVVYRFDFRGCGESGGAFSDITVADQVRQTEALLGFLARRHPVARLHLAGFSMGGLVASLVAARRSDLASLSLLAPAGNLQQVVRRSCDAARALPDGRYDLLALPIGLPLQREVGTLDPWTPLAAIHTPTLVVQGSEDAAVPVAIGQRYAEAIAGARWQLIAGADHIFGQLHARDQLAAALVQHLDL